MIRKRIINYRGNSQKRKTLNIASIEECRIFAYYLYEICSYKTVYYPDDEIDDDYLYLIYGFFSRLAKKMQREKMILNYLSKVIIQYQNHKVLKEISGNCDECFCNTQIPYLYEEDKMIDHMRPRGFNKPTQKIDSLIASIALANHMVLVTRNTKHFEAIQQVCGLEVENWFQQAQPAK
ncbi:MAG: hypothetical protein K6A89_04365 [Treponema sp.]|nr:hypothetical protein [Treponema sp.]